MQPFRQLGHVERPAEPPRPQRPPGPLVERHQMETPPEEQPRREDQGSHGQGHPAEPDAPRPDCEHSERGSRMSQDLLEDPDHTLENPPQGKENDSSSGESFRD
jgi:hypothetical protein